MERREKLWLINDFALFYDKSDDDDIGQEFILLIYTCTYEWKLTSPPS